MNVWIVFVIEWNLVYRRSIVLVWLRVSTCTTYRLFRTLTWVWSRTYWASGWIRVRYYCDTPDRIYFSDIHFSELQWGCCRVPD